MGSNKSRANPVRAALEPQRRPGKERVAALMEAAASVIAERGFEAATMAEIAARAGALIGSLYHFFPNKEVLADALIERYGVIIDEAFAKIDSQAASMPIEREQTPWSTSSSKFRANRRPCAPYWRASPNCRQSGTIYT